MKVTTTTPNDTAAVQFDSRSVSNRIADSQIEARQVGASVSAEEKLTARIFREGSGKRLMKFCRELAPILIRRYSVEDGACDLRESLRTSLMATLKCSQQQADGLIDLSMEMIHAKLHGTYRRSEVDISYLIAMATGAVTDVTAN